MSRHACEALRQGDEMQCGRCGLTWAVDDPARPPCAPKIDKRAIPTRATTIAVKRLEEAVPVPPTVKASASGSGLHVYWMASGAVDAIPDLSDRRFAVLSEDLRRAAGDFNLDELRQASGDRAVALDAARVSNYKKWLEQNGPRSPGFVRPGACAHCGRLPGEEPCDWIECTALSPAPPRLNGCHSKPRPVADSVTHAAQDGYDEFDGAEPGAPAFYRIPRWVPVRHVMSTDCRYDKRAKDPGCTGCPWVTPC